MSDAERIADNCRALRQRIADASQQSGREPDAVRLVAVTKYVDFDATAAVFQAGCEDLGESRPQDLLAKAEQAADRQLPTRWHLVGHLQRNKARRILPHAAWIHSIDSLRLLQTVDRLAAETGAAPRLLLEVNVSGDEQKHGFAPGDMPEVVAQLGDVSVPVVGLMTMAAREGGSDRAQRDFAALRQLRDSLQPQCPDGIQLKELSMGMSGDWEQAIAEGATIVRVGTALFDGML